MVEFTSKRAAALVRREMLEYRTSFLRTPIIVAAVFILAMVATVLLSSRIGGLSDTLLDVVLLSDNSGGMNISIHLDHDDVEVLQEAEVAVDSGATPNYRIEPYPSEADEDWNFSRQWKFNPPTRTGNDTTTARNDDDIDTLNPLLDMLNNLILLVLVFVTANYLLNTLYDDRKDRSILFWQSMPVTAWEEVLSKFAVAVLVAPTVFIAASMLTQLVYAALAMVLTWRLDMSPTEVVWDNVHFGSLFLNQVAGWILTAAWVAPAYAWLMLASAAAKRSPFILAVVPIVILWIVEALFLGTSYTVTAVLTHIPHFSDDDLGVGFYIGGPAWVTQNYTNLLLGLLFTAATLSLTVWLRKYRWEI